MFKRKIELLRKYSCGVNQFFLKFQIVGPMGSERWKIGFSTGTEYWYYLLVSINTSWPSRAECPILLRTLKSNHNDFAQEQQIEIGSW